MVCADNKVNYVTVQILSISEILYTKLTTFTIYYIHAHNATLLSPSLSHHILSHSEASYYNLPLILRYFITIACR